MLRKAWRWHLPVNVSLFSKMEAQSRAGLPSFCFCMNTNLKIIGADFKAPACNWPVFLPAKPLSFMTREKWRFPMQCVQ